MLFVWYFLGFSQNCSRKKHPRNQNKVAKQKCMPTLSTTTKQTQTWSLLLGCWWIRSRIKVADCLPVMLLGSIHKERPLKMLPPWKLTWQWKIHHLKMYFLSRIGNDVSPVFSKFLSDVVCSFCVAGAVFGDWKWGFSNVMLVFRGVPSQIPEDIPLPRVVVEMMSFLFHLCGKKCDPDAPRV